MHAVLKFAKDDNTIIRKRVEYINIVNITTVLLIFLRCTTWKKNLRKQQLFMNYSHYTWRNERNIKLLIHETQ